MRKILIFLFVLTVYIAQSAAVELDMYGKLGTGLWWMKSYKFYDDKIPTKKDPVTGDTLEFFVGEDPYPVNVGDFLGYGTFGVKAEGDKFKGVIELGLHYGSYDSKAGEQNDKEYYYKKYSSFVFLKKWYFEWYPNDYIDILAGQDYAPTCFFPSNQAFYGMNSFSNIGCLYTGRNPMIQFSVHHPESIWKAKVAVVKVDTTNLTIRNQSGEGFIGDTIRYYCEVRVPKTEGSFEFNLEKEFFGLQGKCAGGFQRYYQVGMHQGCLDPTNCTKFKNASEKYPIDSYLVGADIRVKLGMFSLALDGFWGQNVGNYGAYIGDAFGWWFESWYMFALMPIHFKVDTTNDRWRFLNSKVFEVAAILSFKPIDNLAFEGGVGTVQGEHEYDIEDSLVTDYNDRWHPTYAWYFQTRYKIFEKLEITPEVGQYYYGPEIGFGKYTYWGLSTWIEF